MANKDKIEKLEDLIKDSIQGELVEQTVSSLLPPGENYGSVIYKVDFKVRKDGEEQEYHAVAKCTPPNQVTQAVFNTQETFKAEIGWYTTVIPTLKKFAKDQGLERQLDFFQNFYGARISLDPHSEKVDLDGVILTENLKYLGYSNIDRHVGFDASTTFSILRDLATFHAVPLAIRVKDRELFENKLKTFCTSMGPEPNAEMKEKLDDALLSHFDYIPEVQPYMDRVRKRVTTQSSFAKRELKEPWITVIHMDFWCNNIMITGGKDSKNMILDLQTPRLGTPSTDLLLLLFTSVNYDIIVSQLDEFVKFYYDEFIRNLEALKVDTSVFGFEEFLEQMDNDIKTGEFTHIIFHNQMVLGEKGVTMFDASDPDFKPDVMKDMKPKPPNDRQIKKLRWVALEAVKRNWV